jgi:hypothetical protein
MSAPAMHDGNADQAAYWNGPAGRRWMEHEVLHAWPWPERFLVVSSTGGSPEFQPFQEHDAITWWEAGDVVESLFR